MATAVGLARAEYGTRVRGGAPHRTKASLRARNGRHLTIQYLPPPAKPTEPPETRSQTTQNQTTRNQTTQNQTTRSQTTQNQATRLPASRTAAGLQIVRAAGLAAVVRTATEHATGDVGVGRVLPVVPELRALLPGGLRRGALIAVAASTSTSAEAAAPTSLMLALLAEASRSGSWCGVVGVPDLGAVAAAELGLALDRLALVPYPGAEWATVVAALLDGLDIVVAAPPGPIAPSVAGRLAARARQHGSVLVAYGPWRGADVVLETVRGVWRGLSQGRGRLRTRELTIRSTGRGAAATPRQIGVWLPGPPPEEAAAISPAPVPRPLELAG